MRVCVLGAGITGLATAYQLTLAGHEVTVVDRAGAAEGASAGNGGQLSYAYVQPLADPAIWRELPRLLLSPSSPLKVRPGVDLHQWRWGTQFLAACNAARSRTTTARLLALSAFSRVHFDAFREREQVDCDFSATGKLVLCRDEAAFRSARAQMQLQRRLGGPEQEAVGAAEAFALEPALAGSPQPLAGAIFTPGECAADCRKVCDALAALLVRRGVRLLLNTPVANWVRRGARVTAVATAQGEVEADAFVLAAGSGSAVLARGVGVRLPVYPLKGYSITVPIVDDARAPRVNITDGSRKMVFARLGGRLRVAGMAELVGNDASIPRARIETLCRATEDVFRGACDFSEPRPWTGMRPATPTGEPVVGIDPAGPHNLVFNTGHGALGFTLAFGTAQQVVEVLAKGA